MSLPVWPELNYSLHANLVVLLLRSRTENIYASLKVAQQCHSVGLVIFNIIRILERCVCPVICGFCCVNGEGTGIHSYSPQQTLWKMRQQEELKEKPCVLQFCAWIWKFMIETTLCSFLNRLGKALASHLNTDWAQRTVVNCLGLQGATGYLLPGSKCLPEDAGPASWGR